MNLKLGLLSLLTHAAVDAVASQGSPCGTRAPSDEYVRVARQLSAEQDEGGLKARSWWETTYINTYVHIISHDETYEGGHVDGRTIKAQMDMLNANFANTGFQFILQDTTYTVDWRYATLRNEHDEYIIKNWLRRGSYKDLNLYYHTSIWDGSTGWSRFPGNAAPGSRDFIMDGCTMNVGTMPGGWYYPWNEGKVTTHEVGHWLGLIHPFEARDLSDGCHGPGDWVDDTPASASPTYGCPIWRDSCMLPGLDPVDNFMDYTDNRCQSRFTNGQIARMKSWFDYYRAWNLAY
ncbi:metalloprotease MEP1-like protein [Metarhizium rileyi]|uniref:Metalloprotease MEP1-like protein n=1 Tax=Metarhizium rileyi (strain RCEF 4871) TaxID=1649241 RepID=A0A167EAZ2_METRR|nr:metalloprotease MEP1-like protein [Metarhizium rileyi RCEF 4871]TWU72884.1 hypothetical protein ED733_004129 [Metarhizium rileyi]